MGQVPLYMAQQRDHLERVPYLRLIDFVYHSILGFRVIKKKRRTRPVNLETSGLVPSHFALVT